ncbi:hypothetical protein Pflav_067380 [Phytohabitans flavus]|uniref:Putative oxidoreductase/dehydrogenase Rossmann-like domain-containing protein n=1 Tax=Phytohabitans flavus TaxID=1076124 RepID=A0A6F8Y2W7_9ACTN|nr:hypothetical protein Pflav_067380 [Phytohabitans flavus]
MIVGVIGAGRVGAVLGAALARAGHTVVAASGSSPASAARIARLLPDTARVSPAEVARAATDLLLIAVPDDAIGPLVADLPFQSGQVVAHTSGAQGLAVLAPAAAQGARTLALHPAMTFAGTGDDLSRLPGTAYGVTAPLGLRPLATRLVADLGAPLSGSPRPTGRCTTPRSRRERTTWSRSSTRRPTGCATPGWYVRRTCSAPAASRPRQRPAVRRRGADRPCLAG